MNSFLDVKAPPRLDNIAFDLKTDYSLLEEGEYELVDDHNRETIPYVKYFSDDEIDTFVREKCRAA